MMLFFLFQTRREGGEEVGRREGIVRERRGRERGRRTERREG